MTEFSSRFGIGGRSKFQTKIPAIKNEIASISSAQPEPYRVTRAPPMSAPTTNPILVDNATMAFPSLSFSLGKISGSTPTIAGHHKALSTPKIAPMNASSQTDGK